MKAKHAWLRVGGVVLATALGAAAGAQAADAGGTSRSIELPTSSRVFPGDGAGAKAANAYCLMCHSYGMVETQPSLSKAAWLVEVNKMKGAFKAPIPADQVQVIADYLARLKGAH